MLHCALDGGWYYDFVVYHVHLLLAVFLFREVDGALEFASSDSRFSVKRQTRKLYSVNAIKMNMLCIFYRKLRVQGIQMIDMLLFINIFYLDQVYSVIAITYNSNFYLRVTIISAGT